MRKIDDPKKQASIALKKARTHINNVLTMIDKDVYCIDIVTQIASVSGLLKSASDKMLKNHMRTCFKDGMTTQNENTKEKLIQEVLEVVNLTKKHR
ncbi:metal-sensitive transcriptional regulator [candidate division WWE3 bacterium]|nr:metal-sensitive transcriptional regulator [candidate division WWE3 bacterium]